MARKKKYKVRLNNVENLETLMQEVYNDANFQINEAQRVITELTAGTSPDDVTDYATLAKEKTNLLKVKDSSIKIKLDLAKLGHEVIKAHGVNGTTNTTEKFETGKVNFNTIHDIIKNSKKNKEELDV